MVATALGRARDGWGGGRRLAVVDWTLALGLTALAQLQLAFFTNLSREGRALVVVGSLLTLLQTVPVALRRRAPFPILLLTGAAALVQLLLQAKSADFGTFGVLVAFYTVAADSDRRLATSVALLAGIGIFAAKLMDRSEELQFDDLLVLYAQFAAAWVLGDNSRYRRRHIADLEDRAARIEREREYRAKEAAAGERARIARELHDVVTHSLCVVMLQAGAARTVLDRAPETARACLLSIEEVSRQAWAEMRHLLDLVRQDRVDNADQPPRPGLRDLEGLVARFAEAGLEIELQVSGPARPVSAALDLSAYRIVQEALTNTLKHAGLVRARVSVCYTADTLELAVADTGRPGAGDPPGTDGHGLLGMRERVRLFGGDLSAGPGPDGFVVRASLPFERPRA